MNAGSMRRILEIMNPSEYKAENRTMEYYIPEYQRGYRWEIEQVVHLFEDIHKNCMKYSDKLNTKMATGYEYCIQPLAISKNENGQFRVIDGQQRLTTLAIVFMVLNQLGKELCEEQISNKDEIFISYERLGTGEILRDLADKCKKVNTIDLNNITLEYLRTEDHFELLVCDILSEILSDVNNIDGQFMVNVYLFAYVFFKCILLEEVGEKSYFAYLNSENDEKMDYTRTRLTNLREMFKYYVSVIWYEPKADKNDNLSEEDVFDKFNAKKVALTKSELVKALFMNPDNYIMEGNKDHSNEVIKTKQITLGNEWDMIERRLYDTDLWYFIPHKEEHLNTRFDAIIDFFVYREFRVRNTDISDTKLRNMFEDELFSFKQLEKWVKEDLSIQNSSQKKSEVMRKWWEKVRGIYDWYEDFYDSIDYKWDKGVSINTSFISYKIYHRIALIQLIEYLYFTNVTNGNQNERYFAMLKKNSEIVDELLKVPMKEYEKCLNEMIKADIEVIWKSKSTSICREEVRDCCDTLKKKIKALAYRQDKKNILIQIFLVIFSLFIQENTGGISSRFSFRLYNQKGDSESEDWILEHIFAKGTDFRTFKNKSVEVKRELLENLKECGWEDYLEFKYMDILTEKEIDKIKAVKQAAIDWISDRNVEELSDAIWDVAIDYSADLEGINRDNIEERLIIEFLKDNSMGNMGLLTRSDNSSVGNKKFSDKRKTILNRISESKFVPAGVINVFNGTYCDGIHDMEQWYPCHRKRYLEALLDGITKYLGGE